MQTVTQTVYDFNELDESTQQTVLDNMRDINVNYPDWYDFVYEDTKEIGKLLGIDIDNIWFSGFCCQGDGACFEGNYKYSKGSVKKIMEYAPQDKELHQIAKYLQDAQRKRFYQLSATVKHSGHYYHEFCTRISVYDGMYDGYWLSEEIEESIIEPLRDFMRWIYKRLEEEYDYLTSDEMIRESIEANGYTFTKNGEVY